MGLSCLGAVALELWLLHHYNGGIEKGGCCTGREPHSTSTHGLAPRRGPTAPQKGSAAPVLVHGRSMFTTNALQHPGSEAACWASIHGSHLCQRQLAKWWQPAELVKMGQTGSSTSSALEEATCCSHFRSSDSFCKYLLDIFVFCVRPVGSSSIYYWFVLNFSKEI